MSAYGIATWLMGQQRIYYGIAKEVMVLREPFFGSVLQVLSCLGKFNSIRKGRRSEDEYL